MSESSPFVSGGGEAGRRVTVAKSSVSEVVDVDPRLVRLVFAYAACGIFWLVAGGDIVEGDLDLLVHAWGGADAGDWEPERAESPAPIPTWAWVMLIGIIAWDLSYTILYW